MTYGIHRLEWDDVSFAAPGLTDQKREDDKQQPEKLNHEINISNTRKASPIDEHPEPFIRIRPRHVQE
jgi:hypothetical protein